jgi:pyruvate-formate lyase-activating enzyme
MKILKQRTTGLCASCGAKVPARIIEEGGKALLVKECPEHGELSGVLETDSDFMRRILEVPREAEPFICEPGVSKRRDRDPFFLFYEKPPGSRGGAFPLRCLMINTTHGCNLSCKLCYLPNRDRSLDLTLSQIKRAITDYPGKAISLSGGEPTLREDLPEIISHAKAQGKYVYIVTNGIRLTDYDFLMTLKEAGLDLINFSCNGLEQKAFTGIENAPLLETKMAALENVKKSEIPIQLSFTMVRGVNDDQLQPILRFIVKNNDFIYQLRARVGAGVGRRISEKNIYLSQFLRMFAEAVGCDAESLCDYWLRNGTYPNPYLMAVNFTDYLAKQDFSVLSRVGEAIGLPRGTLQVVLFSWPELNTLDFQEMEGLDLDILTRDGRAINFFEGVIRNEGKDLL